MPSDVEDSSQDEYGPRPRKRERKMRLQGACDTCRRRKVKCDSAKMPDKRCTNCISLNLECTHTPRAKRGSQVSYVKILERRLTSMEELLKKMHPSSNQSSDPGASIETSLNALYPPPIPEREHSPSRGSQSDDDDSEELAFIALSQHVKRMSLIAGEDRYFGQSSGFMLVKQVMDAKESTLGKGSITFADRRREFWDCRPWEVTHLRDCYKPYCFPPHDLMSELIEAYFRDINVFYPLLHRPTFEHSITTGLHLHNPQFGATALLVCALGSRCVDDPRVWTEGGGEYTAGWKYFSQVPLVPPTFMDKTSIYDVQYYFLAVVFLMGSSIPHASWTLIGFGLRCAQERVSHRRRVESQAYTVEDELWKRAFWCLVAVDRLLSSFLGRQVALHEEDFDVELPVECDDEYWYAWKQPEGTPSTIVGFNKYLKLCEVLSYAVRTLYARRKTKKLVGMVGESWESNIVRELDSTLNDWLDTLPEHLKWNPENTQSPYYQQSASLYASFCFVRIQVHRPFIQKPCHPLAQTSLMMCTNAAKQCIHVIDSATKQGILLPMPNTPMAAFVSGLILVLNFWANRRWTKADAAKEMQDVHLVMELLRSRERRWFVAGRCYDMLKQLLDVTEPTSQTFGSSTNSPAYSSPGSDGSSHTYANNALPGGINLTGYVQAGQGTSQQAMQPTTWPSLLQPSDWGLNDIFFPNSQYSDSDVLQSAPYFPAAPTGADSSGTYSQPQSVSQWSDTTNVDEWNTFISSMVPRQR